MSWIINFIINYRQMQFNNASLTWSVDYPHSFYKTCYSPNEAPTTNKTTFTNSNQQFTSNSYYFNQYCTNRSSGDQNGSTLGMATLNLSTNLSFNPKLASSCTQTSALELNSSIHLSSAQIYNDSFQDNNNQIKKNVKKQSGRITIFFIVLT